MGASNATMFQNLQFVTKLARDYRPSAYLVRIESDVGLSGIVLSGSSTNYIFSYQNARLEDYWEVFSDGRTQYSEHPHTLRYDTLTDLAPSLLIDSPAAVTAALSSGFDGCIAKGPVGAWRLQMSYDSQAGVPTVKMALLGTGSRFFGEVYISSQNGALLFKDIFGDCR
jgi:hypothetical protein